MNRRAAVHRAATDANAHYDAHYFDAELHRDHWFTNNTAKRARRWQEIVRMLEPRSSDRILDIGCGAGEHAIPLAKYAGGVIGVDRSLAGAQRARLRAVREGTRNASFVMCDAAVLPFADARFDKVAAVDFVEHIVDSLLERVLSEVRRVLVRGGIVAIYTPCVTHYVEWLKDRNLILRQLPGHVAVRGPEAYVHMLEDAGFAIRSCRFLPSDYPLFGALDRALAPLPGIGRWFRFRICIVAVTAAR